MASVFAWIDDSEQQRQRMEDALDPFTVRSTRDELGLSVIRDAFSDLLFPGTGALQTRAAYFLFVPWMYRSLEEERVRSADVARVAKRRELDLIPVLLESGESEGTIGRRAGPLLKRIPSSVYWTGLGRLRIRRFSGTHDAYHRSLDGWYRRKHGVVRNDDGEVTTPSSHNWHPGIPDPPSGWPQKATFQLRSIDAVYLRECIKTETGRSLLARMEGLVEAGDSVPFAWDHPACKELEQAGDEQSRTLHRQVSHARCFSEVMYGAAVLYNLILAEQIPGGGDNASRYGEFMADWHTAIQARMRDIVRWDLTDFWRLMSESGARVHPVTRDFVTDWVNLARSAHYEEATRGAAARNLVTVREKRLKGRLARIDNADAQLRWEGDSGLFRMDFRWSNARRVLSDIATGLQGGGHA